MGVLNYFSQDVADREPLREVPVATTLAEIGTVGAAAYLLRDRQNNQMRTELERYATDDGGVGYFYLFYIAGRLAGRGWTVNFVAESHDAGKAAGPAHQRGGAHIFIEANAKQPTIPVETTDRLWYTIRDIIEEKKQKFADPAFQPGMIVADISPTNFDANETGTPPFVDLETGPRGVAAGPRLRLPLARGRYVARSSAQPRQRLGVPCRAIRFHPPRSYSA